MPTRFYLRLSELLIAATLALAVLAAWRAEHRDRAQLTADLAAAKQSLAQADARQHERDTQLAQTLATLAADKRTITTPPQILRDLPNQIPLPVPITLKPSNPDAKASNQICNLGPNCGPENLDAARSRNIPGSTLATPAILPAADLKPLYDFALDCQACQAKLAATQADLADERAKSAVLTHERDEAVRVARGGSLLHRIARNAKWLAIGALAGAVAAKAHR